MRKQIEICKGTTTLIGIFSTGFVMSGAFVMGVDLLLRLVCGFFVFALFLVLNRQYTVLFTKCKKNNISPKTRIKRLIGYIAGAVLLVIILPLPFVPLIIKALYSGIYTTLLLRSPIRRCDNGSGKYEKTEKNYR